MSKKVKKTISILIPCYNEALVLDLLYKRISKVANENQKYGFEFLFINDGSKDETLEIIKKLSIKDKRISYINLSRNFGKEIAMLAGFDHINTDAVVIIDADLQDPPELIVEMIDKWEQGYDDVYARRVSRAGETWFKKFTSKMFYKVLQSSTKIDIQKDTGDFRLLDKRCIESIVKLRENQRYTKGMFSWIGYKKVGIDYERDPRAAGNTKWNYRKLANFAIDGITSFTTTPLRVSTFIGILISFFAFIYIIVIVLKTIIFGADVAGYSSIMASILFIGGVQLISLGIIGEYVGRIFNETKNRPLYFIDEYHENTEYKKLK